MMMLRILNLEAGYGAIRVLKGVSLHVSPGEVVTLIGANGAGKTTLLSTIAGLVRPTAGEVYFAGRNTCRAAPELIVSQGCSLVPEGRQVFAALTVLENLQLGGHVRRREKSRGEAHAALEEIYSLFPVLRERGRQLAGTLSGGEQQMLAIGRALMARPKMIMMDEPSMGLAPLIVQGIFATIASLKEAGMTILLVEQNARRALRVADRGYVLESGQIVCEGSAADLQNNHEVQRAYLGKDYRRIDE
jgi:branched-chain amino acid transport system ATP-binding protein